MPRLVLKVFISNDGICELQVSFLKDLEGRFRSRAEFEYLNGKENEGQISKYKINTYPTIIIECDGREKERFVGLTQQLFLKKAIDKNLSGCR